jgi:hypothetical protein
MKSAKACVRLKYFGWSFFQIESPGSKKILLDPVYTKLSGVSYATPEDCAGSDFIFVSHPHYEHFIDTGKILESSSATLIASPEICNYMIHRFNVPVQRTIPIKSGESIRNKDLNFEAFLWKHRRVNYLKFLRNPVQLAEFLWYNLFRTSRVGPMMGVNIQMENKVNVCNYSEGFSDLANYEDMKKLRGTLCPDIVLAGCQLNFEEHVARGLQTLSPKVAILYEPHKALFENFHLHSNPIESFKKCCEELNPDVQAYVMQPGDTYEYCES